MALWEWEFRRSTWENMHGRFHLTTHPETETLVLSGDSSDHGHGADAERLAKLYGLFFDLLRQLAGRRQDDGVGTLVRVLNPARDGRQTCVSKAGLWGIQRGGWFTGSPVTLGQGGDPHQQRNQEGSRFTATRLCHADDVAVLQANGDGLPLNRRRVLEVAQTRHKSNKTQ